MSVSFPPEAAGQPEVLRYCWRVVSSVLSKALWAHRSGLSMFTHWNDISQGAWPLNCQWRGPVSTHVVSWFRDLLPSNRPGLGGSFWGKAPQLAHRRGGSVQPHDQAGRDRPSPSFPGSFVWGGKADAGSLQGHPLSLPGGHLPWLGLSDPHHLADSGGPWLYSRTAQKSLLRNVLTSGPLTGPSSWPGR